ncbi:hypothetical protein RFI_04778, partial [Reticulomyxa filosa]
MVTFEVSCFITYLEVFFFFVFSIKQQNIIGSSKQKKANRKYELKLYENIPWLYWADFNVVSNSNLSFDIFDQTNPTVIATATVPESSQVIFVDEQSSQPASNELHVQILKYLVCGIENESSLRFALTVFNDLKTQLHQSKSQDIENVLNDNTPNLDQSNASSKQVCFLFCFFCLIKQYVYTIQMCQRWKLSSKQLFVIVRTLAKDKSATQFHSLAIQNIGSDLDSFVSGDARYEVSCTLIDRLRLIPCVNYLVLSNQLIKQQQLITSLKEFLQRFDFQSSE